MTRSKKTQSSPISVRVTTEERGILLNDAKGQSLSNYVRARLFSDDGFVESSGDKDAISLSSRNRMKLLAQLLSRFGASDITKSLSELAVAAKIGALPVDKEVVSEIHSACSHIKEMRLLLLKALGLRNGGHK